MLDKLAKAFVLLRGEVEGLRAAVERVEKIRPVVRDGKDGKDGKDGVSPDPQAIAEAAAKLVPVPKDGISPDPQEIAEAAAKLVPPAPPGRDGVSPTVRDVADVVLAQIPLPKDGISPDPQEIAEAAAKLVPKPKDGRSPTAAEVAKRMPPPMRGQPGKDGKDGKSVTDVKLKDNVLFVWIDGVKKRVGAIKFPTIAAAFTPGSGGGGLTQIKSNGDNAVYLRSMADFPDQDGEAITLRATCVYVLVASFEVTKPFLVENGALLTGRHVYAHTLTYLGSEDMFTGVDADFSLKDVTVDCPNAQAFNFSETGGGLTKNFLFDTARVTRSAKFGTFHQLNLVEFLNGEGTYAAAGATFSGTVNVLTIGRFALATDQGAGFRGLELGSTTFTVLEIDNYISVGAAGAVGLSGLEDSANLPPGRKAFVSGCEFIGLTPLEGIQSSDVRWEFKANSGLQDSRNAADVYLQGGTETVAVAAAGAFYEIGVPVGPGVSWGSDVAERFSVGADGVMTYNGETPINVRALGSATVGKVGGGSDEIEVRLAVNWQPGQVGLEKSRATTESLDPTSVPLSALIALAPGDNIRPIFANNSSAGDIQARVTSLSVFGA